MSGFTHDRAGTPAAAWEDDARWAALPRLDLDGLTRLVVVAAHPDDETLGAGGLAATAGARGVAVHVVVATAGQHSHPDSPTHRPADLARRRRAESTAALAALAPTATATWLDLEDGHLADHEDDLARVLVDLVGDGRGVLLAAPWRHDGHPDHDAAGRAAATAARRCGARLAEYPVWWWHWGDAADAWPDLASLPLDAAARARKATATAAHTSQVRPLSDQPGDEVLLGADLLAHFARDREVFVLAPPADEALDRLHRDRADPWGVDERWYERRKRDLTLAALPRARFRLGLELGCSVGALTAALAPRCDRLVAVDRSEHALARARERLSTCGLDHVGTGRLDLADPDLAGWPDGRLDLVVVSEVGYFLDHAALDRVVARIGDVLADDGVLVLCHWRHEVVGWPLDGPAVHDRVRAAGVRPERLRLTEHDWELVVLASDAAWPRPDA